MSAKVPVTAVLRATKVLDAVSHLGVAGVREIARHIGADPSTVYRTLITLEKANFLIRDPKDGTFGISPHLGKLARRGMSNYALLRVSSSPLRDLQRRTGETVLLAVPDGTDLMYVDRIPKATLRAEPEGTVQIASGPGYRVPLYATGAGKAYLAALEPAHRSALLDQITLTRLTPNTITRRSELDAELETVIERGWAVNDEEFRMGMRGVGVCILGENGPVACISLTGPVKTMTEERVKELGPLVVSVARRISGEQGLESEQHGW